MVSNFFCASCRKKISIIYCFKLIYSIISLLCDDFFYFILKVFAAKINATFLCMQNHGDDGEKSDDLKWIMFQNNACQTTNDRVFIGLQSMKNVRMGFFLICASFDKIRMLSNDCFLNKTKEKLKKNNQIHKFIAKNGERKN